MALVVTYNAPSDLREIDQVLLPALTYDDVIFKLFPFAYTVAPKVTWEQRDVYTGLMAIRGLNAAAQQVPTFGFARYEMDPGIWGEYALISETEIGLRAAPGTWATPIEIQDLVDERQIQLLSRQNNRIKWVLWQILANGVIQVVGEFGSIVYTEAYKPQVYTPTTLWSNASSSTPLLDERNIWLKHRFLSVTFGRQASQMMTYATYILFIQNTNAADLFGRRATGLATINSLEQYNDEIAMKDDLPNIVIYDETYIDDTGTGQLFLPDNQLVTLGKRTNNAPLGRFTFTRNMSNPGFAAGPHFIITDNINDPATRPDYAQAAEYKGAREIKLYRGFNGGPEVHYPGAIVTSKVA